jgi:hypothetical protein
MTFYYRLISYRIFASLYQLEDLNANIVSITIPNKQIRHISVIELYKVKFLVIYLLW